MTRIKMTGLAITVAFGLMAAASASAIAAENPVLVNSAGGAVTNLIVSGKDSAISFLQPTSVGAPKVECASAEGSGTVSTTSVGTGETFGTGTVTFKKCKTAAGKCSNKGTEEITGTAATLLVWLGKESEKKPGILSFAAPQSGTPGNGKGTLLSFKCSGVLVDSEGGFLSLINRALGESFVVGLSIARQVAGAQEDQRYTENGIEATDSIFTSSGGGAFGPAGEEAESEGTFSTVVKIIEN
jgi:hypothetical protein